MYDQIIQFIDDASACISRQEATIRNLQGLSKTSAEADAAHRQELDKLNGFIDKIAGLLEKGGTDTESVVRALRNKDASLVKLAEEEEEVPSWGKLADKSAPTGKYRESERALYQRQGLL